MNSLKSCAKILGVALLIASMLLVSPLITARVQSITTTLTIGAVVSSPMTSLSALDPNPFTGANLTTDAYAGYSRLTDVCMFVKNVIAGLNVTIPVLVENLAISPSNWAQLKEKGKLQYCNLHFN